MGVKRFLRYFLIGIPIGITIIDTAGGIAKVEGVSMQPTLNPDDRYPDFVFLNRWAVRSQEIQRGEIVSVISPKKPSQTLIKRVVGLPGDIISSHGYKADILRIPEGYCWLEGDHLGHSMDSNTFGPVPLGLITGKATFIVWPPTRWHESISYINFNREKRMRAVSFVKRLQWDLPGTVCRHGLTIGDVDNDGDNELVVGTAEGELYIFKGSELWQKIPGLGLITSVAIGDIFNYGRNALVVICGDGWAHIFYSPRSVNPSTINPTSAQQSSKETIDQDTIKIDQVDGNSEVNELSGKMECVHVQRIPTNTKVVLVADVDKDGANEMILGLTDRVVRSYRWSSTPELGRGKLVGLNKWECANQIGTVTLQHTADGTPTLLVAQPGGTFMRIKCDSEDCHSEHEAHKTSNETAASCVDYQTLGISRMRNQNISTEIIGDLQCAESKASNNGAKESSAKQTVPSEVQRGKHVKSASLELKGNTSQMETRKNSLDPAEVRKRTSTAEDYKTSKVSGKATAAGTDQVDGNLMGGNVILADYDPEPEKESLLPTFKDFSLQGNIDNNNEEGLKGPDKAEGEANTKKGSSQGKPYALATLDGTIMLVKDEVILWAMQVDHQIFALCRLDVTGDGSDEIVACAWDGQTYILDHQQNSVRFHFEEPVRAFCTGIYNVSPGISTPCLVYNTFNNKIFLYYDVTLPSMVIKPLNPVEELDLEEKQTLDGLLGNCSDTERQQRMQQFTEWLLYGMS